MNFPIKAVIFDLDGLLIDSEPAWDEAYYIFLEKHHVVDKPEVSDRMTGMGLKNAIKMMVDELSLTGDVDELTEEYRRLFYDVFLKEKKVLMDGAVDLVRRLKGKFKLAVATGGHSREKCFQILKNVGLESNFDVVISSDDVDKGKPAPDVYFETSRRLNVQPRSCLVLEDSLNGVEAGRAAGMTVFGINADKKVRNELKKAGAEKIFNSLREVNL